MIDLLTNGYIILTAVILAWVLVFITQFSTTPVILRFSVIGEMALWLAVSRFLRLYLWLTRSGTKTSASAASVLDVDTMERFTSIQSNLTLIQPNRIALQWKRFTERSWISLKKFFYRSSSASGSR